MRYLAVAGALLLTMVQAAPGQIERTPNCPRAGCSGESLAASEGGTPAVSVAGGRLLSERGSAGQFRLYYGAVVFGHRFIFDQWEPDGNHKSLVSVDPTGKSIILATHLHEPRILFSDGQWTVSAEASSEAGTEIVVSKIDEQRRFQSTRRQPSVATIIDQQLRLATTTSEQFPSKLALDLFDLTKNEQLASYEIWNVPARGKPVFWNGKVVLVAPGEIALYGERLEKIVSAPAPTDEIYNRSYCGIVEPRIFGTRLIYQISCGRIVVFDLDRFSVVHELARIDPSMHLAYDVDGDLLFAVPTEAERKPNNGAIFDLTTGRRLAVLPLTADAIAVNGDNLLALSPRDGNDPKAHRSILLYRVDKSELDEAAQERAIEEAHAQARAVLSHSGSFEDAIDAQESAATDLLFAPERANPRIRAIALDYAGWLSATLDRSAVGVKLLERLTVLDGGDPRATRRLGAASLRDYALTGSQASLDRGRRLLPEASATLQALMPLPAARLAPIDFGIFPNRIAFWRDKIVVGRWGSNKPVDLALYDRATLQPLWSQALSTNDQDEIVGLSFEGDHIQTWLEPRDANGTRIISIDAVSRKSTPVRVRATIEIVVPTSSGVLGCGLVEPRCVLIDPKTLRTGKEFHCVPLVSVGEDAANLAVLGKLFAPDCKLDLGGELVALSPRWMLVQQGSWPGPYAIKYRLVGTTDQWRTTELRLLRESRVHILQSRDEAIIETPRPELHTFARQNLVDGGYRTLFQVSDPEAAGAAWTQTDQIVIVGKGRDLVLYDLANDCIAGVLRDVIAEGSENNGLGVDKAKIVRLLLDGPRLIALPLDGRHSRVLSTQDVSDYVKRASPLMKSLNTILRE